MRILHAPERLKHYINQYNLQDMFSLDLEKVSSLICYEKNELITEMGQRDDNFLILVEGECIAYTLTGTDKFHCECHFRDVSFLGFVCVLWDEPILNNIQAITPCTFLSIPANLYREELLNDIKFLRFASRWMASHIRKNSSHYEPLETRLASFILEMEQDGLFHYNLTLCADLLETSYRHLLRTLHAMCEMRILEKKQKGQYQILDRDRLNQMQFGDAVAGC